MAQLLANSNINIRGIKTGGKFNQSRSVRGAPPRSVFSAQCFSAQPLSGSNAFPIYPQLLISPLARKLRWATLLFNTCLSPRLLGLHTRMPSETAPHASRRTPHAAR